MSGAKKPDNVDNKKETSACRDLLIDLHVHSTCSDGTCSPEELVQLALKAGLRAIALTDHDSSLGVPAAQKAAEGTLLEVIPGIELSTDWKGTEIHMLGYDLDSEHPALLSHLEESIRRRNERNEKMAEKLTEAGCPVTMEEMFKRFPESVITRAHFGRILMEKGYVTSVSAAFNRYIGDRCPCYVNEWRIDVTDAVHLILTCGGHPVLAHPLLYGLSKDRLESLVNLLKDHGLQGMECMYPRFSPSEMNRLIRMAERHGLFITGGTDFHGDNKPDIQLGTGVRGNVQIPYELLIRSGIRSI